MTDSDLYEWIEAALVSPHGVAIATNSPERTRSRLYPVIKKMKVGDLLRISIPAKPGELWLVKKHGA